MLYKPMLVAASALLVANCSMMTATSGTECSIWRPVSWSSKDTPATIEEVKLNNARQASWCADKGSVIGSR